MSGKFPACQKVDQAPAMQSQVTISVLMSTYNTRFSLVKRAIDSVLNQAFQDFELIVIDDGSDNDPDNQVLRYVKQHEDKVIYLRHKNTGQSNSINQGILFSKGLYITILDADDEYKPNHLEACLEAVRDVDLIASTTETVVSKEEDYFVIDVLDQSKMIHVDDCILFATLFGRRKVFESVQFAGAYAADALFYQLVSRKFRVKKVDLRTYIYYRNDPGSMCSTMKLHQELLLDS
jgi:glycosyltransferase involved in cell wall biosynthesis